MRRFFGKCCQGLVIALAGAFQVAAQQVTLSGSFQHSVETAIYNEPLQIAVSVPFGYEQSQSSYPLLLVLDGDVTFGMATEIPRLMSFEKSMPSVVVAGVTYGDFATWIAKRRRDYHSKDDVARNFLNALKSDVIPFLAQNYRIKADDIGLYGHSSAGWFALFAALEEPAVFQRVLASSPSVDEEPSWAEAFLAGGTAAREVVPKLYVSIGEQETRTGQALEPVLQKLRMGIPARLFQFERFGGMPHMAVMGPAFAKGMMWLYAEQSVADRK